MYNLLNFLIHLLRFWLWFLYICFSLFYSCLFSCVFFYLFTVFKDNFPLFSSPTSLPGVEKDRNGKTLTSSRYVINPAVFALQEIGIRKCWTSSYILCQIEKKTTLVESSVFYSCVCLSRSNLLIRIISCWNRKSFVAAGFGQWTFVKCISCLKFFSFRKNTQQ